MASAVVHLLDWVIASQAFGSHSSQVLLSMFLLHIFLQTKILCWEIKDNGNNRSRRDNSALHLYNALEFQNDLLHPNTSGKWKLRFSASTGDKLLLSYTKY